ncbi:MAG: amidohydrolase family protein [Verrucomicrobiota bacterium]
MTTPTQTSAARRIIDMHVHIVGNGSGGTGCWLRESTWRWPQHAFMLRHIGLPVSALNSDLDRLYVERLLRQVRESSLDAIVILAQEQVYEADGKLRRDLGTAYVPNEYVLQLAREHKEFLPAVSIHPARADGMEELERCLAGGAVMMKCLPNCQDIDCNDRRYQRFWERMAEARLPLLAHTGGEHTLQVVRPELADPRTLRLPLECGVTVIAAHCATKSGWFDPQYFPVLVEMMKQYPNLYADNSAFNVPIRGRVTPECLRPELMSRLVHGSDYPVPVMGLWPWLRGAIDWATYRRWEQTDNVLERDYQLKRAIGFADETFTRINRLLRLPQTAA